MKLISSSCIISFTLLIYEQLSISVNDGIGRDGYRARRSTRLSGYDTKRPHMIWANDFTFFHISLRKRRLTVRTQIIGAVVGALPTIDGNRMSIWEHDPQWLICRNIFNFAKRQQYNLPQSILFGRASVDHILSLATPRLGVGTAKTRIKSDPVEQPNATMHA